MRRLFLNSYITTQNQVLFFTAGCVPERRIYRAGRFLTPSRGCPDAVSKNASRLALIKQLQNNIIYHAAWHTHLIFLAFIACYQTADIMTQKRTIEQHGLGINSKIPACHSSFLPNYVSLNINTKKSQTCFVSRTQQSFLNRWNNMTVCCPDIVNHLDSFIETRYRDTLIALLSAVSLNALTPDQGLTQYFKVMHIAFLEAQGLIEKQKNHNLKIAMKKVIALQRKGLFQHANTNFTPRSAYIRHVLKIEKGQSIFFAYKKLQKTLLSTTENKKEAKELLERFKKITKSRFRN